MEPDIPSQTTQQVPEIQQPVTQPVSSSPSSNKTKYILLSVFILLIIFLVGGGAYYLGVVKQKSTIQINNNPVTVSTKPSPAPTQTTEPTANWKTYTGATFVLKYPTEFSAITTGTTLNIKDSTEAFDLVVNTEPTNLDLNSYVNQKSWCMSIKSTSGKQYQVDLENSLRFDKTPCGQVGSTDIYIVHKGSAYHFSIATQANYDSFVPILNQILSTFKFTDQTSQTDPTANWKTFISANEKAYTSTNGNITFKYPQDWTTAIHADLIRLLPPGVSDTNVQAPTNGDYINFQSGTFNPEECRVGSQCPSVDSTSKSIINGKSVNITNGHIYGYRFEDITFNSNGIYYNFSLHNSDLTSLPVDKIQILLVIANSFKLTQ